MHPSVLVVTVGGLALLAIALALPSQHLVVDPAAPAMSLFVAVAGVVFSGVLFAIVFRAGEWPPAMLALGVDYGLTTTCYDPTVACGVCDACQLRRRGFEEAGVADLVSYVREPLS